MIGCCNFSLKGIAPTECFASQQTLKLTFLSASFNNFVRTEFFRNLCFLILRLHISILCEIKLLRTQQVHYMLGFSAVTAASLYHIQRKLNVGKGLTYQCQVLNTDVPGQTGLSKAGPKQIMAF